MHAERRLTVEWSVIVRGYQQSISRCHLLLMNVDRPAFGVGSRQLVEVEIRINNSVLVCIIQKVYLAVTVPNVHLESISKG